MGTGVFTGVWWGWPSFLVGGGVGGLCCWGIGWAWVVDFAAGFRAAARVPFLASPRKGTKRRGTLTPGPAGFPALLSRSGRLRNSVPAGPQTVLAESPPPALRCSAGVEGEGKPVAWRWWSHRLGVSNLGHWDMRSAIFGCGVGLLAVTLRLSGFTDF